MADPTVVEEGAKKGLPKILTAPKDGFQKMAAEYKGRPSLWAALVVLVIGVVGQILINVLPLPSQEWIGNHQEAFITLSVLFQAFVYLGVIWLGVLLAYWGIQKSKQ